MLALFLAFATLAVAQTSLFSSVSTGQGTYYGGNLGGGACTNTNPPPAWTSGMTFVALNQPQFQGGDQSLGCGMCLEIVPTGGGSGSNPLTGTYYAYVNDECPECPSGNIDFGLSGDGRWDIQWKAVNCPVGGTRLSYLWQGSNIWYIKVQVQSSTVPVQSLAIAKHGSGNYIAAQKTEDNFWQCSGCAYPLAFPIDVQVTSITGEVVYDQITGITTYAQQGGLGVQFAGFTGSSPSLSGGSVPVAPAPTPAVPAPVPVPAPTLPVPAPVPVPAPTSTPWAINGVSLQAGGDAIPSASGSSFYVNVNYGALETAEIVVDILSTSDWSWYGGGSVQNVAPGSGTVSVYVTVYNTIPFVSTITVKPWIIRQTDAGDYNNAPAQLFWPVTVY